MAPIQNGRVHRRVAIIRGKGIDGEFITVGCIDRDLPARSLVASAQAVLKTVKDVVGQEHLKLFSAIMLAQAHFRSPV